MVADKAEEESCSGATADDDNAVRRHLSPADPGRTSGRDHLVSPHRCGVNGATIHTVITA